MTMDLSVSSGIPCTEGVPQVEGTEERILSERGLQQILLDHFPGVALLLKKGTREVILSNQAGKDAGSVCGSTCFMTWGQSQNPCSWCLAEELWTTGKEQCVEINAGEKVFEAHWVPVTDDLYFHYSFDITERKRATDMLQEKETVIQQALSISHSFTFDWDVDTDNVNRSDSCKNVFGIDCDELAKATAHCFSQRVHPDDRQRLGTLLRSMNPSADTYTTNFRLSLSDGNLVTLEETAQAFFDESGKIIRVIGVAVDITKNIQTEKNLNMLNERISMATRSSRVGIWDWDMQNDILIWDDQMYALYGLKQEYFTGAYTAWINGVHPGDRAKCEEHLKTILSGNLDYDSDFRVLWPDGSIHFLKSKGELIRSSDGKPLRMIGVNYDVTEIKSTKTALHDSRELLSNIINSTPDSIYAKDLQGRYLLLNAAAEKVLGKCESDILGKDDYFLFPKDQAAEIIEDDRKVIASGIVSNSVQELSGLEGRKLTFFATRGPLFDEKGGIIGIFGIARDITERVQAEREKTKLESQLIQSQKMESVGLLAGGVAHDFNNMLTIINGHTQLALMNLEPTSPLQDNLQEILKAAGRSADLTRQLLAFARKQTIAPKVLVLNETTSSMLKMLQRLIGEDIHLNWHPATKLWQVNVDPSQLDQILANLCVNARDAIKGNGKITIETANSIFDRDYCVENPGFITGEFVLLAVSDDGCGMDKETQAQIFEPFFTTKALGEGTGLGLATVYGIVKQNNGFIKVYSEPNQGTTFKIYLPRHKGDAGEIQRGVSAPLQINGQETILLVEDEIGILKVTKAFLVKYGYTVLAASKPSEAITLAKEYDGEINLLITDVVMPEMNGRELAIKLSVLHPQLNCLFMSGYTANVIAHHGVLDKGVKFIPKPFSAQELATKVREVLDGQLLESNS